MSLELIQYTDKHASVWDEWCLAAGNSTFLHTRKFLSYHEKRFSDASILIYDCGRLVGLLPAARALNDESLVISHPGATYGGFVHHGWLRGERMIEAFESTRIFYRERLFTTFLYKPLPYAYSHVPAQDDLYALFRIGARRIRCDLSSTVELSVRGLPSERRRRSLKKALKSVILADDINLLPSFWRVLAENLARKHGAFPTHSLVEMMSLIELFPGNIQVRCAIINNQVEAGVLLFKFTNLWHAQYIAASEIGYSVSALDAVFESAIEDARNSGVRFFDFGTSNEEGGLILNEGLYRFKSEFGGGGMAHEYYEWIL